MCISFASFLGRISQRLTRWPPNVQETGRYLHHFRGRDLARGPRDSLADLDAVQLTEVASETAVMILSAARSEASRLIAAAESRFEEAEAASSATLAEAEVQAAKLVSRAQRREGEILAAVAALNATAIADAEKTRATSATEAAARIQAADEQVAATHAAALADIERLRASSDDEARTTRASATSDAERIVLEATDRRDWLLSELGAQRKIVDAMVDDSEIVRAVLVEAYVKSRETLELAISKLAGPVDKAGRQAAAISREIAAIQS